MRTLRAVVLAVLVVGVIGAGGASGCYTEYVVRPTHCRAVWVPGHYGPWGRWHPGHWRCV